MTKRSAFIGAHRRFSLLASAVAALLAASCGGGGGPKNPATAAGPVPAAPTGVTAAAGDARVTVTWGAVANATGYNLYAASVTGVTKANYATLPDGVRALGVPRTYTLTGLKNGTGYFIVVTALNAAGEGAESAEAVATPSGAGGDTANPTTVITAPTTAAAFTTGASPTSLGGTASDDVGVVKVEWANAATGGKGTATGTTFWSAAVPLASGANAITVTATDGAGKTGTAAITITYTGPGAVDGKTKWTFVTGGIVSSSPALGADGTIYVGSNDGFLYAVNPYGQQSWAYPAGVGIDASPAVGSDGTIYAGTRVGTLLAVRPDGTLKWSLATGVDDLASAALAADGTLYCGSQNGSFYAVTSAGVLKWTFPTGGPVNSSAAVGQDGTLYVGSEDGKLYAINPDGTQKWSYPTFGGVTSSPAIGSDGAVYAGSQDRNLYAINPDGTLRWSFLTGGAITSSPVIGTDGTVYVGSFDRKLYAVNAGGTLKWAFTSGSSLVSSPALAADGTLYVGANDNNLYAINANGTQKWVLAALDLVVSSPAVAPDGTIYVGSHDARLRAVNGAAGGLSSGAWPKFRRDAVNSGAVPSPSLQLFAAAGSVLGTDNVQSLMVGLKAPVPSATTTYSVAGLNGAWRYVRYAMDAGAAARVTETGTMTFDGLGAQTRTFTQNAGGVITAPTVAGTYDVSTAGGLTVVAAGDTYAGSLNQDTTLFALGGVTAGPGNVQSVLVGVKAPTGAFTNASLNGDYRYARLLYDTTAAAHAIETGTVTFNGAGSHTRTFIQNAGGVVTTATAASTYAVAANGGLTFNVTGSTYAGSLSADAGVFIAAGETAGTDNIQSLLVGVKAPTGILSNASLQGDYRFARFAFDGVAATNGAETGTVTFDGSGNHTRTFTLNSGGAVTAESPGTNTYSVSTNGTVTINLTGASLRGSVR